MENASTWDFMYSFENFGLNIGIGFVLMST